MGEEGSHPAKEEKIFVKKLTKGKRKGETNWTG